MIPLTRSAFYGPMAVAIMGGLVVATVLTLLFLPALYAAWFRVRASRRGGAVRCRLDALRYSLRDETPRFREALRRRRRRRRPARRRRRPPTSPPACYQRAKLVDERGAADPHRRRSRSARNYVFDYPYSSTPCFLLRLRRARGRRHRPARPRSGDAYRWEGGVGPGHDVVAYSAICAHKMTYPTRQVSFIGYRDEPSPVAGKGKVITCCSDRSVYDPAAGARVVSGPAPQPLAHDPARARREGRRGLRGGHVRRRDVRGVLPQVRVPPAARDGRPRAQRRSEGTATVREGARDTTATQWAKCWQAIDLRQLSDREGLARAASSCFRSSRPQVRREEADELHRVAAQVGAALVGEARGLRREEVRRSRAPPGPRPCPARKAR